MSATTSQRGSIFLEEAAVVAQEEHPGRQFILKLHAPQIARHATPGSFVHLSCDAMLPMRRPLSIMRADPERGTVDVLYKVLGGGLELLSHKRAGAQVSTLGPIGRGFTPHRERPRALLIGGGVGIPPMVFLSETLRVAEDARWQPLVLMGSELPFPFRARPSTILVAGMPDGVIACMPMLDEWGIPSRLSTLAGFAGCFDGYVTELADAWLATLDAAALREVEIFACGPTVMLKAAAVLARRFGVPCQVSLEEFMACAVGGCAGCTVRVQTPSGPAMQRVCVDGPVFDAASVFAD
jgi:dihydroorotate dehydrogenase electron transfer subunit